jgi:hypothetical protein
MILQITIFANYLCSHIDATFTNLFVQEKISLIKVMNATYLGI